MRSSPSSSSSASSSSTARTRRETTSPRADRATRGGKEWAVIMAALWLFSLGACGCGASQRDAMLATYEAQQRACLLLDDIEAAEQCVEDVRFAWRPIWAREASGEEAP